MGGAHPLFPLLYAYIHCQILLRMVVKGLMAPEHTAHCASRRHDRVITVNTLVCEISRDLVDEPRHIVHQCRWSAGSRHSGGGSPNDQSPEVCRVPALHRHLTVTLPVECR